MQYEKPNAVGCSNHGCIIKQPVGMGTNSTCSCINRNMSTSQVLEAKSLIHYLRSVLDERDNEIKELKSSYTIRFMP